jgi:hypothetical protein
MTETKQVQLDAVRALAEHVRSGMLQYLTSAPDLLPRQYAATALARCNRLLLSMFEMRERGFPDVIGILARSYLECWWIGVYLVLAPAEAIGRLNAAHVSQLMKMTGSWGDMSYVIDKMPFSGKKSQMNWKELANRVDELYSEFRDEPVDVASSLYETLYRGESMMSVHGGLGTISGHMLGRPPGPLIVSEVGVDLDDGESRILTIGSLHDTLARTIAGTFGLSRTEIDRLGAQMTPTES